MSTDSKWRRKPLDTVVDIITHVMLSLILAVFFRWLTCGWTWPVLAFMSGIFIDIDHFIDHFAHYGMRFNLRDFFKSGFLVSGRCYVLFHSWELIAAMWGLSLIFMWMTPVATGVTVHILTDYCFRHRSNPKFLSLFHRWRYGFELEKVNKRLIFR